MLHSVLGHSWIKVCFWGSWASLNPCLLSVVSVIDGRALGGVFPLHVAEHLGNASIYRTQVCWHSEAVQDRN